VVLKSDPSKAKRKNDFVPIVVDGTGGISISKKKN
jgi:hypothetical protein